LSARRGLLMTLAMGLNTTLSSSWLCALKIWVTHLR
jgi:hypothetical protein